MKLLFFDLETTGTQADKHGIHQLSGSIVINGEVKEDFNFHVQPHPGAVIEQAALDVAGVTQEQKNARYKLQLKLKEEQEARILQAIYNIVPKVGLPCTICYWSDKRAATVSRIISDRKIAVRHNKTNCLDWYGSQYEILPELEEGEDIFTKRKNGAWCMEGHALKDGVRLMLHYQRHYIDPSF